MNGLGCWAANQSAPEKPRAAIANRPIHIPQETNATILEEIGAIRAKGFEERAFLDFQNATLANSPTLKQYFGDWANYWMLSPKVREVCLETLDAMLKATGRDPAHIELPRTFTESDRRAMAVVSRSLMIRLKIDAKLRLMAAEGEKESADFKRLEAENQVVGEILGETLLHPVFGRVK